MAIGSALVASAFHPCRAADEPPLVATSPAEAMGTTALMANGTIQPRGRPTAWWFEYGPTAEYGAATPKAVLPPRLAAFYRESWDEGTGGWYAEGDGPLLHLTDGGAQGGFVRYREPGRHDPNHDDGIGTVHLSKYLYTGVWGDYAGKPGPYLAAGNADLRDARVSIHVRGTDWVANGTELAWWSQSQSNMEVQNRPGWRHANWAYTGFLLTHGLRSGEWERVEYRLRNRSFDWSYAGNDPRTRERYTYWPIDLTQGNANLDFFHMVINVGPSAPPRGAIDFDEFELAYRNHSLLLPSNGGRLVASPEGPSDPATLTDGWRHGPGRAWRSGAEPAGPLELVYAFDKPVTIRAVQIHQDPEWPAREVTALSSADGETYVPLAAWTLPERGTPNDNFAFVLAKDLDAAATHLKVRIESGYRAEHWGLGEIEVFGEGAVMLPDDDLYHVTADLEGLEPGQAYHFRLVAEQDGKVTAGADSVALVPAGRAPQIATGPSRVERSAVTVFGRLNALGLATRYYCEYGPDTGYGQRTAARYGGLQVTPRTVFVPLTGLERGVTYHYRLVAENDEGAAYGADATLSVGD
jgi:hypothetical protein